MCRRVLAYGFIDIFIVPGAIPTSVRVSYNSCGLTIFFSSLSLGCEPIASTLPNDGDFNSIYFFWFLYLRVCVFAAYWKSMISISVKKYFICSVLWLIGRDNHHSVHSKYRTQIHRTHGFKTDTKRLQKQQGKRITSETKPTQMRPKKKNTKR